MYHSSLKDYVKIYKNFYDTDFCEKVVDNLANVNWLTHRYHLVENGVLSQENFVSGATELEVSHDEVPLKTELDNKIWNALNHYVNEDMAYMNEWFNSWCGYSFSRFNKYDPTTEMKLHCDHIYTLFEGHRRGIPILTVLGALNEDYEGGEFLLCKERIELKTGDVIVFPSNFLYPHEVKPVKSGVRYSFVSWVW